MLKSLCEALLVGQQPLYGSLQILFHILLLLVPQFQHHLLIGEVLLDVQLDLLKDLALDVLCYLLLPVASRLKTLVEGFIFAAHQDHEVEVVDGKGIGTVEVEQQPSGLNVVIFGEEVSQSVLVELGHIELLVPVIVEMMVDDYFADGEIGEVEGLIEELAEGGLACSGGAGDDDVGRLARRVLGYHGCW